MGENRKVQALVVLGFFAGLGIAFSCAQYEDITLWAKNILFDATSSGSKAKNLQEALDQALSDIKTLSTEVEKLKSGSTGQDATCPPYYVKSMDGTYIVCTRGSDVMVRVGDFWVDRYEMQVVDSTRFGSGNCKGTGGNAYGTDDPDDYPKTTFPDSGNWTQLLYACSVKGVTPSATLTWFQAAQACAAAGKHLCTNDEWQTAAAGTPDKNTDCATNQPKRIATGSYSKCVSRYGAFDMVGGLSELVADWGSNGLTWLKANADTATPWPLDFGDGQDFTRGVNSSGEDGTMAKSGLPTAVRRGGDYNDGNTAGVFSYQAHIGPSYFSPTTGARCCRR